MVCRGWPGILLITGPVWWVALPICVVVPVPSGDDRETVADKPLEPAPLERSCNVVHVEPKRISREMSRAASACEDLVVGLPFQRPYIYNATESDRYTCIF
jgi:hypothetical protein